MRRGWKPAELGVIEMLWLQKCEEIVNYYPDRQLVLVVYEKTAEPPSRVRSLKARRKKPRP